MPRVVWSRMGGGMMTEALIAETGHLVVVSVTFSGFRWPLEGVSFTVAMSASLLINPEDHAVSFALVMGRDLPSALKG
jgi:hypothetical protein